MYPLRNNFFFIEILKEEGIIKNILFESRKRKSTSYFSMQQN